MKKLVIALLVSAGVFGPTMVHAQDKCPDPAVTNVSASQVKARGPMARYRFVVEVTNVGSQDFVASSGATVTLLFQAGGKAARAMASQPLPNLAAGQVTSLIFEADVDKAKSTLPAWEDMPFPTEICGVIVTKPARGTAADCDEGNNRLCQAP